MAYYWKKRSGVLTRSALPYRKEGTPQQPVHPSPTPPTHGCRCSTTTRVQGRRVELVVARLSPPRRARSRCNDQRKESHHAPPPQTACTGRRAVLSEMRATRRRQRQRLPAPIRCHPARRRPIRWLTSPPTTLSHQTTSDSRPIGCSLPTHDRPRTAFALRLHPQTMPAEAETSFASLPLAPPSAPLAATASQRRRQQERQCCAQQTRRQSRPHMAVP